jgi:flavin reductase
MASYTAFAGPKGLIPAPVVVVGVYKDDGQPNFSVAAAAATVCSGPPILSVSFREATLTHSLLPKRKEFTINVVSASQIAQIDYVGSRPGATEDNASTVGWATANASKVNAPYSPAFGIVYQCRLFDSQLLGSHTIFYGEVVEVNVRNDYVGEGGVLAIAKLDPLVFSLAERGYFRIAGEKFAQGVEVYKTLKQ